MSHPFGFTRVPEERVRISETRPTREPYPGGMTRKKEHQFLRDVRHHPYHLHYRRYLPVLLLLILLLLLGRFSALAALSSFSFHPAVIVGVRVSDNVRGNVREARGE